MTGTLETQLTALCEQHGLETMSFNVRPDFGEGFQFYVYAHADGIIGADGHHGTIAEAIAAAISNLNAKRYAVEVADLPAMGEASA